MQKIISAIVLGASLVSFPAAAASPVDSAVKALYRANDRVQAAIEKDVCANGDFMDIDDTAGKALSKSDRKTYNRIGNLLMKAGGSTIGTDSALQQVHETFCAAAADR